MDLAALYDDNAGPRGPVPSRSAPDAHGYHDSQSPTAHGDGSRSRAELTAYRRPQLTKSLLLRSTLLGVSALLLAACHKPPQKAFSFPPPEVTVVRAHAERVPRVRELVGRLAPTRVAEVRARVAGIILKRDYTEGTDVKEGQVLFQIDPAPLEANLHAQEAALAQAQANAANAAATAKRFHDLSARGLASRQDLDNALAAARSTAAAVKQAQANVETARLNLGYATVRAPIAGRAGRALVSQGALVGQGTATELTSIQQIDPIYVNFSQSTAEFEQLQEAEHGTGTGAATHDPVYLEVTLPDGTAYGKRGTLDFSDLAVDPSTATVSLRGILPNPDRRLLPGMFVDIRLTAGYLDHAFLLPQAVLLRDDAGAYVYVVNAAGKVEQRRVQTHGMTLRNWILTGKLKDGDSVIVSGLQKVRPGAPVKVVSAKAGNGAAARAAAKP